MSACTLAPFAGTLPPQRARAASTACNCSSPSLLHRGTRLHQSLPSVYTILVIVVCPPPSLSPSRKLSRSHSLWSALCFYASVHVKTHVNIWLIGVCKVHRLLFFSVATPHFALPERPHVHNLTHGPGEFNSQFCSNLSSKHRNNLGCRCPLMPWPS